MAPAGYIEANIEDAQHVEPVYQLESDSQAACDREPACKGYIVIGSHGIYLVIGGIHTYTKGSPEVVSSCKVKAAQVGFRQAVTRQEDGHPDVVLRDDGGSVMKGIPNEEIVYILDEVADSFKIAACTYRSDRIAGSCLIGWAKRGNFVIVEAETKSTEPPATKESPTTGPTTATPMPPTTTETPTTWPTTTTPMTPTTTTPTTTAPTFTGPTTSTTSTTITRHRRASPDCGARLAQPSKETTVFPDIPGEVLPELERFISGELRSRGEPPLGYFLGELFLDSINTVSSWAKDIQYADKAKAATMKPGLSEHNASHKIYDERFVEDPKFVWPLKSEWKEELAQRPGKYLPWGKWVGGPYMVHKRVELKLGNGRTVEEYRGFNHLSMFWSYKDCCDCQKKYLALHSMRGTYGASEQFADYGLWKDVVRDSLGVNQRNFVDMARGLVSLFVGKSSPWKHLELNAATARDALLENLQDIAHTIATYPHVDQDRTTHLFMGHSLGGAMSALSAGLLRARTGNERIGVIAMNSPGVLHVAETFGLIDNFGDPSERRAKSFVNIVDQHDLIWTIDEQLDNYGQRVCMYLHEPFSSNCYDINSVHDVIDPMCVTEKDFGKCKRFTSCFGKSHKRKVMVEPMRSKHVERPYWARNMSSFFIKGFSGRPLLRGIGLEPYFQTMVLDDYGRFSEQMKPQMERDLLVIKLRGQADVRELAMNRTECLDMSRSCLRPIPDVYSCGPNGTSLLELDSMDPPLFSCFDIVGAKCTTTFPDPVGRCTCKPGYCFHQNVTHASCQLNPRANCTTNYAAMTKATRKRTRKEMSNRTKLYHKATAKHYEDMHMPYMDESRANRWICTGQ